MSRWFCETWDQPHQALMFICHRHSPPTFLLFCDDRGSVPLLWRQGLTFSCYQRQSLLADAARCDLFLKILERVRRRYRLVVLGYVVMPEHVHLLVSEPQRETLSTAIQALKLGFVRSLQVSNGKSAAPRASRSRKRSETWGTPSVGRDRKSNRFWQARFYDFNVWTEKKRIEKLRYIHRNPVARGLVASPEQWLWSSFRWYLSGEVGPVKINDTEILVMKIQPPAA
jgi:putative transposase